MIFKNIELFFIKIFFEENFKKKFQKKNFQKKISEKNFKKKCYINFLFHELLHTSEIYYIDLYI